MRPIRRVCVSWGRFGPYHVARLAALGRALAARGVELVALETASDDETYVWDAQADAAPYRRETLFPGRSFESVPGPEMARAMRAALDRIDPDALAVASYSTPDSRAGLAWSRRRRRTAVMLFDSRRQDADRAAWREAVKRALVGQFDAALVAGTPQRAYAVDLGIPPSHAFQPVDVVDNARFARLAAEARAERAPDDARRFLAVSRLTPIKGIDVLVDAYALYRADAAAPWELAVVGYGPERQALEAAAGPGVTFSGFASGDALGHAYGRADALVLPSHKDTWGLVVNEAMAAGLPVVVSDGAGCAVDLVAPGANGFTVPAGDPAALADRLARIAALSDAERAAFGDRSRAIVSAFGLDDFADGLWAAIEAGGERADRGLSLPARAALAALRVAARRPRAFQAIPD
ncbi:glycosyltransferase [Rubrivirga sp. IMCC45206]|uniref:glycosyltransferase n=1 Tax=Rubrivirga sp. IMCC45206 TaxID=3391614 RepID=UPI00398FEB19